MCRLDGNSLASKGPKDEIVYSPVPIADVSQCVRQIVDLAHMIHLLPPLGPHAILHRFEWDMTVKLKRIYSKIAKLEDYDQ